MAAIDQIATFLPRDRYSIVVSGLADLVTALAVLRERGVSLNAVAQRASVALYGGALSLPEAMVREFVEVCGVAFPGLKVEVWRFADAAGEEAILRDVDVAEARFTRRVVVGNLLHSPAHRRLYAAMNPRHFVFYDNGLSSYADYKLSLEEELADWRRAPNFDAYLTHGDALGVPSYLGAAPPETLSVESFRTVYEHLQAACVDRAAMLDGESLLILGTSFYRTKLISLEDERDLHQRLIADVRRRFSGRVVYKPHPRCDEELLGPGDAVEVLRSSMPVEALVAAPGGHAFSFSSTALLTLQDHCGWRAHRAAHPLMDKVFANRRQLQKIYAIPASTDIFAEYADNADTYSGIPKAAGGHAR